MSAYVVNPHHINVLVSWAGTIALRTHGGTYYWRGGHHPFAGNEQRVGDVLWRENMRSVNYRYRQDDSADGYVFQFVLQGASAVQIIKAVHCLEYQSCETDDWPETEAHAILRAIEREAMRALPGYDKAAWELRP